LCLGVRDVTRKAHRGFKSATALYLGHVRTTNAAKDAHTSVLFDVFTEDSKLDVLVEALAQAMAGAGIGRRSNPFKAFIKDSPSKLKDLAYSDEADEVGDLLKGIQSAAKKRTITLNAAVKAKLKACAKQLAIVRAAIKKLQKPSDAAHDARTVRDVAHAKAGSKIQTLGAYVAAEHGANSDEFKRVFAPADPIVLHRHKKKLRVHDKTAPSPEDSAKSTSAAKTDSPPHP
jgi:hypothetical protein